MSVRTGRWYPPQPDRMTAAERIEAHRIEQEQAERNRELMAKKIKSPTGIVRKQPDRDGADEAISSAHHAVTDALAGVEQAMKRDQAIRAGEQAERNSDQRRQRAGDPR